MNASAQPISHILLLSFVFSPNLGGVETHLDDLVSYLSGKNYYVTVLTYQPLISDKKAAVFEKRKQVEIHRLPWIKGNLFHTLERIPALEVLYLVPLLLIYCIYFVLRYRKKVDVIQAHGFNMAIVGALVSFLFRIPLTVQTHVSFSFTKNSVYSYLLRTVLNSAKNILVLTKSAKHELTKIGVEPSKIAIYHYWVDRVFRPLDQKTSRKQLGWPEHRFTAVFVGRLIPAKGIDMLLEASQLVSSTIRFIIIGSGPLLPLVKQYASNNRNILYIGEKRTKELPVYYSAADICVIPSAQPHGAYTEGIPRVMIESFSCGTPVIATEMGGLGDYVSPSVGRIVSPNSRSIADGIRIAARRKARLSKKCPACVVLAQSEFSRSRNAKIIEKSLV